ncbi:histidine phosphatase family protein [Thermopolyspora sp. NPDC052614]|uniref:histidine phosphatase family protein n=1 Tax=Thermopolyspora sp. NPDC052614 TaxID=3155682 RepID=UPI003449756B
MRGACFPGDDEADPASLAKADGRVFGGEPGRKVWVSPARAASQTAYALGMVPQVAVDLAEADAGRWRGRPYARIAEEEPEALAAWLADPDAAPHGGESLRSMSVRVAAWMDAMRVTPDVVVVCDVGVIRAALGHALGVGIVPAARFDIAPLSATEIALAGEGWRVAYVNHYVNHTAAT